LIDPLAGRGSQIRTEVPGVVAASGGEETTSFREAALARMKFGEASLARAEYREASLARGEGAMANESQAAGADARVNVDAGETPAVAPAVALSGGLPATAGLREEAGFAAADTTASAGLGGAGADLREEPPRTVR
jgi:hypothetical protein